MGALQANGLFLPGIVLCLTICAWVYFFFEFFMATVLMKLMFCWFCQSLLTVMLALLFSAAHAGPEALCRPLEEWLPPRPTLPSSDAAGTENQILRLWSERAELEDKKQRSLFLGGVLAQRLNQVLRAEEVSYQHDQDMLLATGKVTLWDEQFIAKADEVTLRGENEGQAKAAEYWLPQRRGHGKASKVIRYNEHQLRLENSYYTTCDPLHEFWRLQAKTLDLDLAAQQGTARQVTVQMGGVPILYTPYLRFPLGDQRQSGVLPPRVGYADNRGVELEVPYYWNLAPNYDATITPHLMSQRGLGIDSEFRYLTPGSQGIAQWEYLPYDRVYGEGRSLFSLNHQTRFTPQLLTTLLYQEASDNQYFTDFGSGLELASTTHLERRADVWFSGGWFSGLARVQDFQTLDPNPAARPYRRLPQILLTTGLPARNRALNVSAQADINWFDRDVDSVPTGLRQDWQAQLSYPWYRPGWFIEPALTLQYTAYQLSDQPQNAREQINRFVPKLTLDSGLVWERALDFKQRKWLQTLEPRLFYRYAPHRDQDDIPIFDTAQTGFSLAQMFRSEFYAGPDRIGDEQRLTLALVNRVLESDSGAERLRLGIGQVHYFHHPTVTLPGGQTIDQSDIIGEISIRPTPAWFVTHTAQWDKEQGQARQHYFHIRYHPATWKALNFAYRMRDESLGEAMEQADISWQWPLSTHWRTLGRWNYSLEYGQSVESLVGLEYDACCWAVRTVFRRHLLNLEQDYSTGFYVQFELKGLGRLGKKTSTLLTEQIPGFSPLAGE